MKIVIGHVKNVLLSLLLTQHEHARNLNKQFDSWEGVEYYFHYLYVMFSIGQNELRNGLKAKIEVCYENTKRTEDIIELVSTQFSANCTFLGIKGYSLNLIIV